MKNEYAVIVGFMIISISIKVAAKPNVHQTGGRSAGLAQAYVAIAQGPEAIYTNPAGLRLSQNPALMFCTAHPFGLRELSIQSISGVLPLSIGGIGISLHSFGNQIYHEYSASVGWGQLYQERFYYGIRFMLNHLQIQSYGSDTALSVDLGCLLILTYRIQWGAVITNVNRGRIGEQPEVLPQVVRTGLAYIPKQGYLLALEVVAENPYPVQLRGGIEIHPIKSLFLRCGFSREPSMYSVGIGIDWRSVRFDYALNTHLVLGSTHQGSITIDLKPI